MHKRSSRTPEIPPAWKNDRIFGLLFGLQGRYFAKASYLEKQLLNAAADNPVLQALVLDLGASSQSPSQSSRKNPHLLSPKLLLPGA